MVHAIESLKGIRSCYYFTRNHLSKAARKTAVPKTAVNRPIIKFDGMEEFFLLVVFSGPRPKVFEKHWVKVIIPSHEELCECQCHIYLIIDYAHLLPLTH